MDQNRKRLATGAAFAAAAFVSTATAHAQVSLTSQQGASASLSTEATVGANAASAGGPRGGGASETGVNLSESVLLHVGMSAEAGYDSNVFYERSNPRDSAVLRLTPFVEITNAARGGGIPGGAFYDLSATLLYREYLSGDSNTQAQRAFNPAVSGLLEFGTNRALTLTISDSFVRIEEPPYGYTAGIITRDTNLGALQLRYSPGGGRFTGTVRYSNILDYFESDDLKYANSMSHEAVFDVAWKWLPKTALYVQYAQGFVTYLNKDSDPSPTGRKLDSFPLRALAGLRGLVTEKLSFSLGVGYNNAFYESGGKNPSGWGNFAAAVEGTYRPTLLTSMTLGYRHEFRNSPVVGNFYNVDGVYAGIRQALGSRIALQAFGRFENRRYDLSALVINGTPTTVSDRSDNMLQAGLSLDVFIRSWFYAGASYLFTYNKSNKADEAGANSAGLDFNKSMVLARLGVTY